MQIKQTSVTYPNGWRNSNRKNASTILTVAMKVTRKIARRFSQNCFLVISPPQDRKPSDLARPSDLSAASALHSSEAGSLN